MSKLDNLKKLPQLNEAASSQMKGFNALNESAFAEGSLSIKHKELIALAVALTTQCDYCLEIHKGKAKAAGASSEEIAETVFVTAALRAGAAVTHATQLID